MSLRPSKHAMACAIATVTVLLGASAGAQSVFDDAVAYWAFEGNTDTIVDSKGVANMAVADGGSPVRITGLVGGALQINHGDQQYATTGGDVDALDFNSRDPFSVAGWVRQHEGSPVFLKMANTSGDNYRGWHIATGDGGEIDFLLRSTNSTADKIAVKGSGRIPMGEWVHLAATYDYDAADATRGVRIYVNGALFDTYLAHGGLETEMDTTNDKPFQFTARETREYLGHYDTGFDEVGVWNRALSQAEIQELVNTGVPDTPTGNFITNGDFEDTTGWVAPDTDTLPPEGWSSHIWRNNPAARATGAAAVGGEGSSALMEGALLGGISQRGMGQGFAHATDSQWQFDMDFATNAPSTVDQRTLAMTLRTDNGAQISLIVTSEDEDGAGNLRVGAGGYVDIAGLEDSILFDNDLTDVSDSVHHLTIIGHFDEDTPCYDITITDPNGVEHTAAGITEFSSDMGELVTGAGIGHVGFYTYKSYGNFVIDNVSLVNVPEPSCFALWFGMLAAWLIQKRRK